MSQFTREEREQVLAEMREVVRGRRDCDQLTITEDGTTQTIRAGDIRRHIHTLQQALEREEVT